MNSGQGHETSFPQLLCEWLGVPFETIKYVAHDTDRVKAGGGSHSGRSMRIASLAIGEAVDKLISRGKKIAGHLLQAQEADVTFAKGAFTARGAAIGIFEVAKAAASSTDLPQELRGQFGETGDVTITQGAFPSGAHVCEVEVDEQTGQVEIVDWYGVDDVGLAINPMILHGQTAGAIAQGAGQALFEHCVTDERSGQMLSASFMDYAMPRAHNMPNYHTLLMEVPATSHRFGVRPGGEGGTTPALGAVVNAVVDALAHLGVRHIEMPLTPEAVWRAIRDARQGQ
jgi:carbon-monoxide dehydrogenase large subunit